MKSAGHTGKTQSGYGGSLSEISIFTSVCMFGLFKWLDIKQAVAIESSAVVAVAVTANTPVKSSQGIAQCGVILFLSLLENLIVLIITIFPSVAHTVLMMLQK